MSNASKVLGEILDHFKGFGISPDDAWAFDDECNSLCLDHRSLDGTKFWIDLQRDGTIIILWKPAGTERPEVLQFNANGQEPSK